MTPGVERSALRGWAFRGDVPPSAPPTRVDCTGDAPRVLREGATPVGRLRCLLPDLGSDSPETT